MIPHLGVDSRDVEIDGVDPGEPGQVREDQMVGVERLVRPLPAVFLDERIDGRRHGGTPAADKRRYGQDEYLALGRIACTRTPGRTGKPRQPLSCQEFFTFRANRPLMSARGRSHRPEVPPGT